MSAHDAPRRPTTLYDKRAIEAAVQSGVLGDDETDTVDLAGGDALESLVQQGRLSVETADEIRRGIGSDLVPGYEIERVVGRGGMGVVYRAVQRQLGRPVALKLVDPTHARKMRFVDRFRQEAQALARLNHANIAQVYDAGNVNGQPWIAMEFVDGDDCDTMLARGGPFTESMALTVVRDAALALSHALSAGIIHRDVKPGNLMLTRSAPDARGGGTTTKVTDLGLAHLAGDPGDVRVTQPGTVVGTPPYMAPEQLFDGVADHRVDVYALGATLYHLVTGDVPFGGTSMAETITNKRGAFLADPRKRSAQVSEGCIRVLDRMLARDPEQRYDDYPTLIRDVEAVLDGKDPAATPLPEDASSIDWGDVAETTTAQAAEQRAAATASRGVPAWVWIAAVAAAAAAAWFLSR